MKNLYTISEVYRAIYNLGQSIKFIRKASKKNLLSSQFKERLMLAVTEVNQCEMCSYAHTKMALESGLDEKEINELLGGELSGIPEKEMTAILFAQHYADSRSCPSDKAWDSLVNEYGKDKAKGILGVVRMITFGNILGIPFGSLRNRLKRKPSDPRSSIGYEIGAIFILFFVSPIGIMHGLISSWCKK